jgi:hypothetical protein
VILQEANVTRAIEAHVSGTLVKKESDPIAS